MPLAATGYVETIGPNEHLAILDHGRDHYELAARSPYEAAERAADFCRRNGIGLASFVVSKQTRTANLGVAQDERRTA